MTKLTGSTYVKITLVVLLCLVLCGGIFSCSVGCSRTFQKAGEHFMAEFDAAQFENVGDTTIDAHEVNSIEVQWLAGAVDVVLDDDEHSDITLVEQASSKISDRQKMRWRVYDHTLQIAYGWENSWLMGCSATSHKNLTITMPKTLGEHLTTFTLQAASGAYSLGAIGCDSLNIDLASGNVDGTNLRANNLSINMASGVADISSSFSELVDLDVASGNVNLQCPQICPSHASIDLASGNVNMGIPEDSDFVATVNKMSGSFDCEFANNNLRQNGNTYTVGDGKSNFNVGMTSGQVILYPYQIEG